MSTVLMIQHKEGRICLIYIRLYPKRIPQILVNFEGLPSDVTLIKI